jgi:hypothetical protein
MMRGRPTTTWTTGRFARRRRRVCSAFAGAGVLTCTWLVLLPFGGGVASASVTPAAAWTLTPVSVPTALPSGVGRKGEFTAIVENIGGAPSEAGAILHDRLPAGLTATRVKETPGIECEGVGGEEVTCRLGPVVSSGFVRVNIEFEETTAQTPGASLRNALRLSGGGAPAISAEGAMRVRGTGETGPGPAGVANFSISATGPAGEPASQAGGHPTLLTTSVFFNSQYVESLKGQAQPVQAVKDLVFYLPLGLLGDPAVAEQCPFSRVILPLEGEGCSPASRIGTVLPMVTGNPFSIEHGIYNIVPEKGYAAEFAFSASNLTFVSYASVVRHDGTYMTRVEIPGLPAAAGLVGFVASLDGDLQERFTRNEAEQTYDRGAFLTDPSDCTEGAPAREATAAVDTWEHPDVSLPITAPSMVFPSLTGCESLLFSSALTITPETTQADEPSGYEVGLDVPQAPNEASALGTPPVRNATVTLPAGTTVSPSSANGLEACPETGPGGINIEGPESEEIGEDGLEHPAPGHCPRASQIATVHAVTPLLREELTGRMFLATPQCGGQGQPDCTREDAEDGKLVGLDLELEGPHSGIVVKLKGSAKIQAGSGRISASFEELPQFPFSKFLVTTKQGARAPLENSQVCGPASSSAVVTPWSPGTQVQTPSDEFTVDWNGGGQGCPVSAPFAPTFTAGTTRPVAASTSPFTLTLKREDREQNIDTVSTTLPEGLLADLSKVVRCPESQASQASLTACPAASQIGTTTVAVGPGSEPYYVSGKVFFTGPYAGAPFGLSVVVPAVAGPFNLGNVLVRVRLLIDPHTARATAVSDPLPQELDGIPLRMRMLNVTLTDGEFVLNPTSCAPASITGTVTSATGASAGISSPFVAGGCENLPFKATFSASTEARSTKAHGTGVRVKISYPSSGEANIAKVVLGFPKALPVRLETLQKACRAAVFEANPAACPSASDVGSATVHTPILSQPLRGPIYLVSYGSAKFPDAVLVLQGEGITLDVDGQSFVSHSGALTVTFASVPDAPFSTFEGVLPAGPFSQFTSVKSSGKAQGSQCGENLVAPVKMVAHNGAEVNEKVKLLVTGCRPSVSIVKAHATSHGLVLTVRTSVKGRLSVSGPGLRSVVRRNVPAGTHKLTVALTAAGKAAARAHRKVQLSVGLVVGKQKGSTRRTVVL